MLGINDNYVLAAYLLCLASTALCVVYGLINWNRGDDSIKQEDAQWAAQDKKIEQEEV